MASQSDRCRLPVDCDRLDVDRIPGRRRGLTTIEITLPDELAQEAIQSGMLSPAAIEQLLRERLKAKLVGELFEAMEIMHAVDQPSYMSLEESHEEIAIVRAERRASNPT